MAIYEQLSNNSIYGNSGNTENSSWSILDLEDDEHGKVIDVTLFQSTGFADFSFQPILANNIASAGSQTVDLSDHIESDLVFDLRIVNWGENTIGIFTNMQCGWPCRSAFIPIANQTGINLIAPPFLPLIPVEGEWTEVRIPMQYFIKDNLSETDPWMDLTRANVISIAPPWADGNAQRNVHFQIDNLRIVPTQTPQNNTEPALNFFMAKNTFSVFANTTDIEAPSAHFTGSIEQADSAVFLLVDINNGNAVTNAEVSVDLNAKTGDVWLSLAHPNDLGAGIYSEVVTVRACKDQNCNQEYRGSPQRVNVHYVVNN
ncbi:MAG TPA: hypothetical protein DIW64_04080 [Cellvibrio sp.]|nr:hypothetical protein [Cellvibrio sp.]